jgi:hypothetical protein
MTTSPPRPEVDPDYVHVAFSVPDLGEMHDCSGSVTLKKRCQEVRSNGRGHDNNHCREGRKIKMKK